MEHRIRDAKGTILIYKGEPICYNILNTFAEQLGEALQRLGEEVEYFDVKAERRSCSGSLCRKNISGGNWLSELSF